MDYKKDEIEQYFKDWIAEQHACSEDWIEEHIDDLHYYAFNEDYYIIGNYEATQWLGNEAFNVIGFIQEYENDNFGEVFTDLSDPVKVVNMYVYILGEEIVYNWLEKRELEEEY